MANQKVNISLDTCRKIYVDRDYTKGLGVKFATDLPKQLDSYLDPDAWSKTISTINAEFAEAEKVGRITNPFRTHYTTARNRPTTMMVLERGPTSDSLFVMSMYREFKAADKPKEAMKSLHELILNNDSNVEFGLDFRVELFDEMIQALEQFIGTQERVGRGSKMAPATVQGLDRLELMDQLRSLSILQSQESVRRGARAAAEEKERTRSADDSRIDGVRPLLDCTRENSEKKLDGRLNKLRGLLLQVGLHSVGETVASLLSCYVSKLFVRTRYQKKLHRIRQYIEEQNERVFIPAGLYLIDPMERGLRTLEVNILSTGKPAPNQQAVVSQQPPNNS